jgi:hypothetical protein
VVVLGSKDCESIELKAELMRAPALDPTSAGPASGVNHTYEIKPTANAATPATVVPALTRIKSPPS